MLLFLLAVFVFTFNGANSRVDALRSSPATLRLAEARPDVSVHDNYFYFDSNTTVTAQFNVSRVVITDGQPYESTTCDGNRIDVRAGRKGSAPPAAAFEDSLSLLNMMATEKIIDGEPSDLNFAVFGTLQLTFNGTDGGPSKSYTCLDFRLGQGHYLFTNNWWLGSSYFLVDTYGCVTGGQSGRVQFHAEGDSDRIYVLPA